MSDNNIGAEGAGYLAKNTTLSNLDVSCNNIGAEGAGYLAKNTTLTSLDVSYNNIGDDGVGYLAKSTTLSNLYVSYNNIGDEGAGYLAKNTTLSNLDVNHNNIGPKGADYLAKNTTLTSLDVRFNEMGGEGHLQIKSMLHHNSANVLNFKNEVCTIGQGLRDTKSFFSNEERFPIELVYEIVDVLAKEHGLFANKKLNKDISENLFPRSDPTK